MKEGIDKLSGVIRFGPEEQNILKLQGQVKQGIELEPTFLITVEDKKPGNIKPKTLPL